MKKRITACLLVIVLFSGSVIGTYDRAEASSVVIGTVGVAEFILSLLASAGVTYITVDTLTQGWGSQSKKAYEELAAQLEQSYEGRRLEVIEGGGGEQPPQWDKFMDAALTAKTVEYTPGIWDCVKHAINEVMKTRYDVANQSTSNYYLDGSVYFVTADGKYRFEFCKIYRGYYFSPEDYIMPEYVNKLSELKSDFLERVSKKQVLYSPFEEAGKSYFYRDTVVNDLRFTSSISNSTLNCDLHLGSFLSPQYGYTLLIVQGVNGYSIHTYSSSNSNTPGRLLRRSFRLTSEFVPSPPIEIVLPPYMNYELGDGFYYVSAGGSRDVSIEPDSIIPGSSEPWKEEGELKLPSSPPIPTNFPTIDQIQELIDALNRANEKENEEEKKEEESTVVDDFFSDLVKPNPGTDPEPDTKPDPGTDPEPDTKPAPGTDPEPDTKPDPGTDPNPGTDPKPDTEIEPSQLEVDLTTIFPFCIPFDLIKLLSVLDAEPETPVFDLNLPSLSASGEVVSNEFTVDLSSFNGLMEIVRMGELLVFLIGLAVLTGHVIKW